MQIVISIRNVTKIVVHGRVGLFYVAETVI